MNDGTINRSINGTIGRDNSTIQQCTQELIDNIVCAIPSTRSTVACWGRKIAGMKSGVSIASSLIARD